MLRVKLPIGERIHPKTNRFAAGVESKGAGDLKVNDSPGIHELSTPTAQLTVYNLHCSLVLYVKFTPGNVLDFNSLSPPVLGSSPSGNTD